MRGDVDARLGWYLIVATIPISIFGFAFDDQIETGARDLYLIGTVLIVFAFVMLAAERFGRKERDEGDDRAAATRSPSGFAQALRAGARACRARARRSAPGSSSGMKREAAARFSFLLSMPAIVLAALYSMRGRRHRATDDDRRGPSAPILIACAVRVHRPATCRSPSCCGS